MKLSVSDRVFIAASALIAAIQCELFRELVIAERTGSVVLGNWSGNATAILFALGFFALFFALIVLVYKRGQKLLHFCYKWRFAIAAIAFVVLVALSINGSSLAWWASVFEDDYSSGMQGALFGIPRPIRSDEWLVFTPMAMSQEFSDYSAVSSILGGGGTDVTMVYAQPAWALATLFRPFLWGYLVLGSQGGLSFFWCGRSIVLLLVSFEFGRLIAFDNKPLAASYALLVSFAPIVQWWFAVNGTAELLIYSQGIVLAFHELLRARNSAQRWSLSLLLAMLAGCFILVLYPAWQICIGYLVIALVIAEIIEYWREKDHQSLDLRKTIVLLCQRWCPLFVSGVVVCGAMVVVLFQSMDTVQDVLGSVYPGDRFETGGGAIPLLLNYVMSWTASNSQLAFPPNVCEFASFFTLFPAGIIAAVFAIRKRKDPWLICLLIVYAMLLLYGCVGFPAWLAKITLLSKVTVERLPFVFGMLDLILLFRAFAVFHKHCEVHDDSRARNELPFVLGSAAFSAIVTALFVLNYPDLVSYRLVLSAVLIGLAAYACTKVLASSRRGWQLLVISGIIAIMGFFVNPIQQGTAPLTESEFVDEVSSLIAEDRDTLWMADGVEYSQACAAAGARTLTSVATYPDLEKWQVIDPNGEYVDVYNRYASIRTTLTHDDTYFELEYPDRFKIWVNPSDVAKLHPDYWVSPQDYSQFNTDDVRFTPVAKSKVWTIYRVEYL